jgi:uncharacterized protein (DUF2249 family)
MQPPEPLERTMEALDRLGEGDRVRLLVPHEPQPLYRILTRNGYAHAATLLDDGSVEVLIWKRP